MDENVTTGACIPSDIAQHAKGIMEPRFRYLVLFLLLISPFSTCGHGFPYVEWLFHVQKWAKMVSVEVEHIAFLWVLRENGKFCVEPI